MNAPARIVHFARPLQWVVDLDLTDNDAQLIGEALAGLPKVTGMRNYRAPGLRLTVIAQGVVSDDVRRVLLMVAERCGPIRERTFSVVGAALVARHPRDEATRVALRKLTRDPRVLERLGLQSRTAR